MTEEELKELLNQLREYVGDDKAKAKAVAKALHDAIPTVGQTLIDRGAGLKQGETQTKLTEVEAKLKESEEKLVEVEAEFEEFKKKTPDAASLERQAKDKYEPKIRKLTDDLNAARQTLRDKVTDLHVADFVRSLISDHHVDPDYATEVLGAKHRDRFKAKDDFSVDVLGLGETTAIQPTAEKSAAQLLAADVIKKVKPVYILVDGDGGSGLDNDPETRHSTERSRGRTTSRDTDAITEKVAAGGGSYSSI